MRFSSSKLTEQTQVGSAQNLTGQKKKKAQCISKACVVADWRAYLFHFILYI